MTGEEEDEANTSKEHKSKGKDSTLLCHRRNGGHREEIMKEKVI